jgi:isopenicillin N synthase-like dioxygenase
MSVKKKLAEALKQGFFYLEIPEECRPLLSDAIEFADTFHRNEAIKALKLGGFNGYHDREHAQVESFYCERELWRDVYSSNLQKFASKIDVLALELLKRALEICEVPDSYWNSATVGLMEGKGSHYLSFNHYRPEKNQIGIKEHRDFGFVTFLYTDKKGLECRIENEWVAIPPKENHLIVNFGRAFEILVNDPQRLNAAWHRVKKVEEDRTSFALFLEGSMELPTYRLKKTQELEVVHEDYTTFLNHCFKEAYSP